MCEKCVEIDKAIARYQRMLLSIFDQLTMDRIKDSNAVSKKVALHTEQESSSS